ncbi:D-alanyl-D-alanine carboxypeptidase/D-alanyl-D-alanine endopeptidase, partial [Amycolatopsis acidiphila]
PQQRPAPPPRPIPPAGLQHAQPMRIEPSGEVRPAESAQPDEPTPPPPPEQPVKRKRRGLLIGAVALVVVIVVGVALALPPVSNRLGLPWAPNFPKADTPEPAAVTLALQPPSSSAPTPTNSGVAAELAGPAANPALGTLAGIVIDPATGSTLWNHNSSQLLTPASATKLLTTSAALLKLDHGLQIPTKVVQGSSPDTAIIVAGGDVTLSALPDGQQSVLPGAAHLDDLVAQVKQASGGSIKKVQIDVSLFSGPLTAPGWAPDDAPSTYAAPIVPGMLDAGRPNPTVDEVLRSADPAGTLLQTFAQRLGATASGHATAPQGAKVLGEVRSAPLTELVDNLLQISDNTLAEAVGRQTAIASGAPATFAGVAQTTLNTLAQNGFDVSGVALNDGSGLSTLNKVPPRLLAQLLTVAAAPDNKDPRTAKLRPLLEGLPVAGGSGTLADRYGDANSSAGKGWVRAKTGTLSGVNTLAGVVLDKDGRVLVFAMMSNGSDIVAARPALDALAAALRGCGCG